MAKKRKSKRSKSIVTTKAGRRLHPGKCSVKAASKLLRDRKLAKDIGVKPPYRRGDCAVPSASYALAHKKKAKKRKPSKRIFGTKVAYLKKRAPGKKPPKSFRGKKRQMTRRSGGSLVDWFF